MAIDIKVPAVGESISEGTIARWLKKSGAAVRANEPLFELETDKATQEVPAPASGTLTIKVKEGDKVAIGAVVGSIDPKDVPRAETKPPARPSPDGAQEDTTPPVSPAARRLAAEEGVDPAALTGTGRHGLILKEDVQKALSAEKNAADDGSATELASAPVPTGEKGTRETRQKMSPIRQRIAEKLVAAQQTTASLTTFNEADLSAVMDLRARYKESFHKKHGVGLGFMPFFVKAAVEALKAFPIVNARIDGGDIVFHQAYHIGVAVSTDKGLMVPVLRDADHLSCAAIEKTLADLAGKARDGKISLNDLQGGTFTVTNGGVFGSMLSTPILNPPQCAILGMHAIQQRPVARDGQVVIRPMMYLALTYDHRLIDGREAVQFLVRIKDCIEDPQRLFLEV